MGLKSKAILLLLIPGLFAAGCNDRGVSKFPPATTGELRVSIPVEPERALDILFVIDSSGSMQSEQDSLAANFDRMIDALTAQGDALPSLHIGVVTTDLNVSDSANCPQTSTPGQFVRDGQDCQGPDGAFIVDTPAADGSRNTNYSGNLADTFSCIARVGAKACHVYEQPFEAMRRVLSGEGVSEGFLREDAFLAVILITDEDDCSASNLQIFESASGPFEDSRFGPRGSFRCFEFGTVCDGDDPRSEGDKTNCVPRDNSDFIEPVSTYVNFLQGLKDSPSQVLVAAISGSPDPVSVETSIENNRLVGRLANTCQGDSTQRAQPSTRLDSFIKSFSNAQQTSICADDLSGPVQEISNSIAGFFEGCLNSIPGDIDPSTPELDLSCTVSLNRITDGGDEFIKTLPACTADGTEDCYSFVPTAQCASSASGLQLELSTSVRMDEGTFADVRCLAGNSAE